MPRLLPTRKLSNAWFVYPWMSCQENDTKPSRHSGYSHLRADGGCHQSTPMIPMIPMIRELQFSVGFAFGPLHAFLTTILSMWFGSHIFFLGGCGIVSIHVVSPCCRMFRFSKMLWMVSKMPQAQNGALWHPWGKCFLPTMFQQTCPGASSRFEQKDVLPTRLHCRSSDLLCRAENGLQIEQSWTT